MNVLNSTCYNGNHQKFCGLSSCALFFFYTLTQWVQLIYCEFPKSFWFGNCFSVGFYILIINNKLFKYKMDRYTSITRRRPHTAIKTMSSCLCVFFWFRQNETPIKHDILWTFFARNCV